MAGNIPPGTFLTQNSQMYPKCQNHLKYATCLKFSQNQNQKLIEIQNRGCLMEVAGEVREKICQKRCFAKILKVVDIWIKLASTKKWKNIRKCKGYQHYKTIPGSSDSDDFDFKIKTNLLDNMIEIYLSMRSFSLVKSISLCKKNPTKSKDKIIQNSMQKHCEIT